MTSLAIVVNRLSGGMKGLAQIILVTPPLILLMLGLPVAAHLLRRRPKLLQGVKWCLFLVYIAINLRLTLIGRNPYYGQRLNFQLFWSFERGFVRGHLDVQQEIILNVLLYIPLGYLLLSLFPRLRVWRVILIGMACSVLTEATQYAFYLGLCELDDVFTNTLGTAIGASVWWLTMLGYHRLFRKKI